MGTEVNANIDRVTPEFAISVKKEFRRQGIGVRLMKSMISLLKEQDEDYLMVLKL